MSFEIKEDFTNLLELVEYFDNEQKCIDYFANKKWGNSPVCPHCGCKKVYSFKDGKRYKCASCRKQFTVRIGTIFEDSKVSLKKWFMAMYLLASHKKGISSHQLARDIGVTQRTAWFMLHRIRYAFEQCNIDVELEGDVELDETYVGGKNKNRHFDKKVKHSQGRSIKDKVPVFGMIERGGIVIATVVPDVKMDTLHKIIKEKIKDTARLMTDEYLGYNGLDKIFTHLKVNHGANQYVIGEAYTNTIEGFWSHLKRMVMGVYHSISRKHLQRYVDEECFRFNTRKMKDAERMNNLLSLCCVRLTYNKLVYG